MSFAAVLKGLCVAKLAAAVVALKLDPILIAFYVPPGAGAWPRARPRAVPCRRRPYAAVA